MFERFTASARQVVVDAHVQARDLAAREITAEHLLLAISADGTTRAGAALRAEGLSHDALVQALRRPDDGTALRSIGIDLDEVRRRAEAAFGPGALDRDGDPGRRRWSRRQRPSGAGHLRFTDSAKRALEQSLRAVVALHAREIAVEHVLLGLLADDDDLAARALQRVGVAPDAVRRRLRDELGRAA